MNSEIEMPLVYRPLNETEVEYDGGDGDMAKSVIIGMVIGAAAMALSAGAIFRFAGIGWTDTFQVAGIAAGVGAAVGGTMGWMRETDKKRNNVI